MLTRADSAAGSSSCCTRTTRRSGPRRPTRSACSSASRRSSASTPCSASSSRSLFNLNRVAVLLGVYSNLPWILPAYYTLATMVGRGDPAGRGPARAAAGADARRCATRSWGEFWQLAHALWPLAWAFVLGSTLGAIVLAADRVSRRARDDRRASPAPGSSPRTALTIDGLVV